MVDTTNASCVLVGEPLPVQGVRLASGRAGLYKKPRPDLVLLAFGEKSHVAATFTLSATAAAPVLWSRDQLANTSHARALLINAGCANAATGAPGLAAAQTCAAQVGALLDVPSHHVQIGSTGVIGVPLDVAKIASALPALAEALSDDAKAWSAAAAAIMTTDTIPKAVSARVNIDGHDITITGIAKGSGMIAPNMATMLAAIASDAPVAGSILSSLCKRVTQASFNRVTVDGDCSTNDAFWLIATGEAPIAPIDAETDPRLAPLEAAIEAIAIHLAQKIARDGEGATKFVRIHVAGAANAQSARKIAKTIAESPLVKTALAASDANWGRVVAAIGRAGVAVNLDKLSIDFGTHAVVRGGLVAASYDEAALSAYLRGQNITISIDLGLGAAQDEVWTCDLTHGYIDINGSYRS